MKTLVQYVCMAATIGGVLLAAGCSTTDSTRVNTRTVSTRQIGPTNEFTVIDSSFGRELTAQELSQLRDGVAKYLESQGVARSGEYYVRVDFAAATPDTAADWVVVKVTNLPASTYTLIAAYPAIGPDDYYPYAFSYNQGYGYWGSSYGFYDPPVYYPANYHPRPSSGVPHHRDDDGKPGDHRKGDKDNHPRGGTPANYDGPRNRPEGTPHRDYQPDSPRYAPRTSDSVGGSSGGHRDSAPRSNDGGGSRSYSPPPASQSSGGSNISAPPAPVSAPVSRTAPDAGVSQRDQRQQD